MSEERKVAKNSVEVAQDGSALAEYHGYITYKDSKELFEYSVFYANAGELADQAIQKSGIHVRITPVLQAVAKDTGQEWSAIAAAINGQRFNYNGILDAVRVKAEGEIAELNAKLSEAESILDKAEQLGMDTKPFLAMVKELNKQLSAARK